MKVVIAWESMYGNTHAVAEGIAEGLQDAAADVIIEHTSDLKEFPACDLLVVGAPTHALGLPTAASRQQAVARSAGQLHLEARAEQSGLREWIAHLADTEAGRRPVVAIFDTRLRGFGVLGHAGRRAARQMRRHGLSVAASQSFFVDHNTALVKGELERAKMWGASLAALIPSPRPADDEGSRRQA